MPKCRLFSCQTQAGTLGRCLWTPHGTTPAATRRRRPRRSPTRPPQWPRPPRGRTAGCTRGARTCGHTEGPLTSSTPRSRASSPGSHGRSRTWRPRQAPPPHAATASMARGATCGRSMRSPSGHARSQARGTPQPEHRNALPNARISDSQSCVEPDAPMAAAARGAAIASKRPAPVCRVRPLFAP